MISMRVSLTIDEIKKWILLRNVSRKLLQEADYFVCYDTNIVLVMKDERVYALGSNENGQLCLGHRNATSKFEEVYTCTMNNIVDLVIQETHGMYLTDHGCVHVWGHNEFGQIAAGNKLVCPIAVPVLEEGVIQISCGKSHSLALTNEGTVLAWGKNDRGETGTNARTKKVRKPLLVNFPPGTFIEQVSAGLHHSLALTNEGHVFGWGENKHNHLGCMHQPPNRRNSIVHSYYKIPILLNYFKEPIKKVTCGFYSSMFLTRSGSLYRTPHIGPIIKFPIEEPVVDFLVQTDIFGLAYTDSGIYNWQITGYLQIHRVSEEDLPTLIQRSENIPCSHHLIYIDHTNDVAEPKKPFVYKPNGNESMVEEEVEEELEGEIKGDYVEVNDDDDDEFQDVESTKNAVGQNENRAKEPANSRNDDDTGDDTDYTDDSDGEEHDPEVLDLIYSVIQGALMFFQTPEAWFNSPHNSDIEFVFENNKRIRAHRITLLAASDYMSDKFGGAWRTFSHVHPTDYPYEIYYSYIYYLYTRKITSNDLQALIQLLHLARVKREISLYKATSSRIYDKINTGNACKSLELADHYEHPFLKKLLLGFICEHFNIIKPTKAYSQLNEKLLADISAMQRETDAE